MIPVGMKSGFKIFWLVWLTLGISTRSDKMACRSADKIVFLGFSLHCIGIALWSLHSLIIELDCHSSRLVFNLTLLCFVCSFDMKCFSFSSPHKIHSQVHLMSQTMNNRKYFFQQNFIYIKFLLHPCQHRSHHWNEIYISSSELTYALGLGIC